jgi:hypothetical protein
LLGFQGCLPHYLLGIFYFAGHLLGLQRSRSSGGLSGLGGDQRSSLLGFGSSSSCFPFGYAGNSGSTDRRPTGSALDGGRTISG